MPILPSARAMMKERFIFNFRMPLDMLQRHLPVPWLLPQPINGYGVASFCLLEIRNITIAPLPPVVGLTSVSCVPRYAALDALHSDPTPTVFMTRRYTNSAFGSWFTTLGFAAPHPYAEAAIDHRDQATTGIRVRRPNQEPMFTATVQPASDLCSTLFASTTDFRDFIAAGVSSYAFSRHRGRLVRVDLHKKDADYTPLHVVDIAGGVVDEWKNEGAVFDSAFYTTGGRYEWFYRGLTAAAPAEDRRPKVWAADM